VTVSRIPGGWSSGALSAKAAWCAGRGRIGDGPSLVRIPAVEHRRGIKPLLRERRLRPGEFHDRLLRRVDERRPGRLELSEHKVPIRRAPRTARRQAVVGQRLQYHTGEPTDRWVDFHGVIAIGGRPVTRIDWSGNTSMATPADAFALTTRAGCHEAGPSAAMRMLPGVEAGGSASS
jgi:hypothetical protein